MATYQSPKDLQCDNLKLINFGSVYVNRIRSSLLCTVFHSQNGYSKYQREIIAKAIVNEPDIQN
jgi:hypothetical protein